MPLIFDADILYFCHIYFCTTHSHELFHALVFGFLALSREICKWLQNDSTNHYFIEDMLDGVNCKYHVVEDSINLYMLCVSNGSTCHLLMSKIEFCGREICRKIFMGELYFLVTGFISAVGQFLLIIADIPFNKTLLRGVLPSSLFLLSILFVGLFSSNCF